MAQFGDNTYCSRNFMFNGEVCLSNFRRLSIVSPKYLALLLMRIDELFNERSIVGGGLLSLGGIIRALDLEGFTVSLFE